MDIEKNEQPTNSDKKTNKYAHFLGQIFLTVNVGCILAIVIALTKKLIMWLF